MTPTAAEIRQQFLDFFQKRDHSIVPSAPVVPHDDPTLLFTNAGMNQFKDVFLGRGSRDYRRAADTQKCIRAGGKHNDLEDVGRDTYHHTFFEMLGNWSFGDYFKQDAIAWAWELLTDVYGLDPQRLHVTVFEGDADDNVPPDTDAETIWAKYLSKERIQRFGRRDNFWEMGDTGPCGPCSEIHYDATPDKSGAALVNAGDPRVIEIWNLVFIQFNRGSDGRLTPLPDKHVDTGMGFERIVRVVQGKASNYDTDVFAPIFAAIESCTGARRYGGRIDDPVDIAYRVVADHVRCLSVAIADGAQPSNEGRGYVLRRILRRAVRHAHQTLGVKRPVLDELVQSVSDSLGGIFPELRSKREHIQAVIRREEEAFLQTLDRGLELFEEAAARAGGSAQISADDAFKLHDTYGFPIDLTRTMAEERGMTVDEAGYEALMEDARERSRGATDDEQERPDLPPEALAQMRHMQLLGTVDAPKYESRPITATVLAIWNGHDFDERTLSSEPRPLGIVLDRTNFYAEQGGQISDLGRIGDFDGDSSDFRVEHVQRFGEYVVHFGRLVRGELAVKETVQLDVRRDHREPVKANHTATHLLNHALRQVLGEEVEQKGSLVAPDRLRFDFSFSRGLTPQELNAVERLVNAGIHQDLPVHTDDVPLEIAKKINGVRAVFGEKYPDPVRVVSLGPSIERLVREPDKARWLECSIEFCGGTHLSKTGEAKRFIITQETALASGVRRITALTGVPALAAEGAARELESRLFRARALRGGDYVEEIDDISRQCESLTLGLVGRHGIQEQLAAMRDEAKRIRREGEAQQRQGVVDQARVLAESIQGRIIVDTLLGADADTLRAAGDVIRSRRPEAACMLFASDEIESKVSILALVPPELVSRGLKAGDWVRVAAQVVGGGGGGRPDMAQAGGKDPAKVDEAMRTAKHFAEEQLK